MSGGLVNSVHPHAPDAVERLATAAKAREGRPLVEPAHGVGIPPVTERVSPTT